VLHFLSLHLATVWKAGTTVLEKEKQRLGVKIVPKSPNKQGGEQRLEPTSWEEFYLLPTVTLCLAEVKACIIKLRKLNLRLYVYIPKLNHPGFLSAQNLWK